MSPRIAGATRTLMLLVIILAASANAGTEEVRIAAQSAQPAEEYEASARDAAVATARGELVTLERRLKQDADDVAARVQRLRLLYFLAIDDEAHLEVAEEAISGIERHLPTAESPELPVTLEAYAAALRVLEGKHATWPWSKLSHVRTGLGRMDEWVERAPDHVELRYLRLVSGYYLPGIFRRGDAVREDFRVLERLLPETRRQFPASTFAGMAAFVLEHGPSDGSETERLERALDQAREAEEAEGWDARREARRDRRAGPGTPSHRDKLRDV